jgi:hypothetical protein
MAGQILQSQILGQTTFISELNQDAITLLFQCLEPVAGNTKKLLCESDLDFV